MKIKIARSVTRLTLCAVALLATSLFGSPANAQSDFHGKFTLPCEVRWGQAVLPAGDYTLTFLHGHMATMLVVREAKSGRTVAYESIDIREDGATGESALFIGARGRQRVVSSLRLTELGEVFIYDPALAHGRYVEEARQTQAVPVLAAKN
jgi:hypothetical protein